MKEKMLIVALAAIMAAGMVFLADKWLDSLEWYVGCTQAQATIFVAEKLHNHVPAVTVQQAAIYCGGRP